MSPKGRPEGESAPKRVSAEGSPVSAVASEGPRHDAAALVGFRHALLAHAGLRRPVVGREQLRLAVPGIGVHVRVDAAATIGLPSAVACWSWVREAADS